MSDGVKIEIIDTGPGIPDNEIKKIYDPFYSTKRDVDPSNPHAGLGLSLVWRIIKDHEGIIEAHSKENSGTTFTLYLPAILPIED